MTAPYRADTPALLVTSIGLEVTAAAHLSTGALLTVLDVEALEISWDAGRAPRVVAQLTCRVPTEQAVLEALDPRAGVRLRVAAGYVRPDGVRDVFALVDLGLRVRGVRRPDNRLTLSAASDEALVMDADPGNGITPAQPTVEAAVRELVAAGVGTAPAFVSTLTPSAPTAAITVPPEGELWAVLDQALDTVNADAYDEGLRTWTICPRPVLGAVRHELLVGTAGTITGADTQLTREDWHNAAAIVYRWEDVTTATDGTSTRTPRQVIGRAQVTTGPYAVGPGNRRTYREVRTMPVDQAGADAAAAAVLARRIAAGRTITLSAIAALWLRPGMTVRVALPTGPSALYLVTVVSFDVLAGRMNLTLTRPDDATIDSGA